MNPKEIGSDVDLITCVRIGRVPGFCEHGNETSDPTKCGEFLDSATVTSSQETLPHIVG